MGTTNLNGETGSSCKQSGVLKLQLIEEKHGYVTNDWPSWVVSARSFQFTIVLPVFAAIVRYYGGGSERFTFVSILVMAVTVRVAGWSISRRYQHDMYGNGQTVGDGRSRAAPDQSASIKCVGMRQELARIRCVDANFFEPYIFEYMPYPHSWNDWVALTITLIALFAFRGHGLILDIFAPSCVLAGWLVIAHAFSGYVRIVPGRLDILRVSLFGAGDFRLTRSVSLRDKSIVCHFARRKLTLRPREVSENPSTSNSESVEFDLRRVATPHTLVRFAVQGAMCPVDAP